MLLASAHFPYYSNFLKLSDPSIGQKVNIIGFGILDQQNHINFKLHIFVLRLKRSINTKMDLDKYLSVNTKMDLDKSL